MGISVQKLSKVLNGVLGGNKMYKKEDFTIDYLGVVDCGWYIAMQAGPGYGITYLHKDLQLHEQSGYEDFHIGMGMGMAPGYYLTKKIAEEYLNAFLEKEKMDSIEIIVKANGKVVPLDTVSTETFESMKKAMENSNKPKYEGVYTAKVRGIEGEARVIFEVTQGIADRVGKIVALDRDGYIANINDSLQEILAYQFSSNGTLYDNIKRLGD